MLMAMVGDVMLGRGVAQEIPTRVASSFWGNTLSLLHQADLVIAGLECAITTETRPWTKTPKVFHFRAPPQAIEVLRAAGVRLVSLANNHTLDFDVPGLFDTLNYLDAAGIAHAGAGRNLAEARRPAIVEAGGRRIGMVAFTDNEPAWAAGVDQPGINYLPINLNPATIAIVAEAAAAARQAGAEFVVLSLHWGPNMRQRPPRQFQGFAAAALDAGVDLIYGHSAHIFQGVAVLHGKPVLYDTGDFLDDYAVDPVLRNDQSLLFMADIGQARTRELRMYPVRLRYASVNQARGQDAEDICSRMQALSAELGTQVERCDSMLRLVLHET